MGYRGPPEVRKQMSTTPTSTNIVDDVWAGPPMWLVNTFPDGTQFSTPKCLPNTKGKLASVRAWWGVENTPSFKGWLMLVENVNGRWRRQHVSHL